MSFRAVDLGGVGAPGRPLRRVRDAGSNPGSALQSGLIDSF